MTDYINPYFSLNYPNPRLTYNPTVSSVQPTAYNNTFQWVQGRAGAEAYLVAPGASVILMDSNAPVIYFKSADQNGRYLPMKTYDLVERVETVPEQKPALDTASFVKRDEIDNLVAKAVENYLNAPLKKGD